MRVLRPKFEKPGCNGLVNVIVKDARTGLNLIEGSTNEQTFRMTLETGTATLFSKSRNEIWVKGKTSGNEMLVIDVRVNCDGSAVEYYVEPQGKKRACHTEAVSCFYRSVIVGLLPGMIPEGEELNEKPTDKLSSMEIEVNPVLVNLAKAWALAEAQPPWLIQSLEDHLRERAKAPPEESYTRKLLDKGKVGCAKKVGEEAVEFALALACETNDRVVSEGADLVYHLLVALQTRGLRFAAIETELQRRTGKSGLVEKAERGSGHPG